MILFFIQIEKGNIMKKITLLLFLSLTISMVAKETWNANVSIESISKNLSKTGLYSCNMTIKNIRDDDAQSSKLMILLPIDMKYKDFKVTEYKNHKIYPNTIRCKQSKLDQKPQASYVECSIGNLGVGANISLKIRAKNLDENRTANIECSAFIYSLSPDGELSNNYKVSK